jgi:hypothetical protein
MLTAFHLTERQTFCQYRGVHQQSRSFALAIHGCDTAPTPTGFAEIVGNYFPVPNRHESENARERESSPVGKPFSRTDSLLRRGAGGRPSLGCDLSENLWIGKIIADLGGAQQAMAIEIIAKLIGPILGLLRIRPANGRVINRKRGGNWHVQ